MNCSSVLFCFQIEIIANNLTRLFFNLNSCLAITTSKFTLLEHCNFWYNTSFLYAPCRRSVGIEPWNVVNIIRMGNNILDHWSRILILVGPRYEVLATKIRFNYLNIFWKGTHFLLLKATWLLEVEPSIGNCFVELIGLF